MQKEKRMKKKEHEEEDIAEGTTQAQNKLREFAREAAKSATGFSYQFLFAAGEVFVGLLNPGTVVSVLIEGVEDVDVVYTDEKVHSQLKYRHAKDSKDQLAAIRKALVDFIFLHHSREVTPTGGSF